MWHAPVFRIVLFLSCWQEQKWVVAEGCGGFPWLMPTSGALVCQLLRKTGDSHHLILSGAWYTIPPCFLVSAALGTEHVLFCYPGVKTVLTMSRSSVPQQKAPCALVTKNDPGVLRVRDDHWGVLWSWACFIHHHVYHHHHHGLSGSLRCLSDRF